MLRNYRLRFALLIVLLLLALTTPVRGDPGPFGKITPPDGAEHQPLTPPLSWEESVSAVGYEYCFDTTDNDDCEAEAWIPSGTVALPPSGLAYNTTYYWQVRAIDAADAITYADDGTWWSFTTLTTALAVDKALTAQSATSIVLGTVLTYTVTATNTGEVILSNVMVSDTLLTPSGGTSPCETLVVGAHCTLVGVYTVTQADVDAGMIVNTGSAASDEVSVAATDTVTTSILQHPALAVDKALTAQSATPIAPGTVLTYTITATNTGDVTLSHVVVSDTLVTPSSVGCSTVALGATCVLIGSYAVQESDFMAGEIVNTATVTADDPHGDPLTPVIDTVITPLVAAPPVANPDTSPGNPIGQAVTVDVLVNDIRGDLPLDPASVMIVNPPAGSTLSPDGKLLLVPDEGNWLVNTATGAITFTPLMGFTGDPTPITYTVDDVQGHTSNAAMVTVTYTEPPVATDDAALGNPVGSAVTVTVLTNDSAAVGRTLDVTSVMIMGAPGEGKTLVVPGEGVWTADSDYGAITFTPEAGFEGNPTPITYTVDDDQGNTSNAATVTITYTDNPLARNDASLGNPVGQPVTVDVLVNDVAAPGRTLDPASVQITGTANPGESLVVAGVGVWTVYTTTGAITFTPEEDFAGDPTPITYTVDDDQGNVSNPARVTITYTDEGFFVYLPLAVRNWPPIPAIPVLNAINNPEGDGNYTVSWSDAERATAYVLQESNTPDFSDAVQVYSGTETTLSFSDRGPTRYYYRVQARNIFANSAWSDVRSVDVVWEKEPNDDALTQANGPLVSELTYYGHFPSGADRQDYFFIYLQSAQIVELWLSNIAPGQDYDLTLRNTALQVVGHSGELGNANEHIRTVTLPAGWYYIQIYNRSGSGSTQAYHLRVAYPATVLTAFEVAVPMLAPRPSNLPPAP